MNTAVDAVEEFREDCEPTPVGTLSLRLIPTRQDSNLHGDISGGWVVAQMDLAAENIASQIAQGRIANVALESVVFMSPILVSDVVSFYTRLLDIGSSSIRIGIEVWTHSAHDPMLRKVVDAEFVYVAIDEQGRIRRVPRT